MEDEAQLTQKSVSLWALANGARAAARNVNFRPNILNDQDPETTVVTQGTMGDTKAIYVRASLR